MPDFILAVSLSCAIVTCLCTAWNVWDRISTRSPVVKISGGILYVMNPKKNAIHLNECRLKGEDYAVYLRRSTYYGMSQYKLKPGGSHKLDCFVDAGQRVAMDINVSFYAEQQYIVSLSRVSQFDSNSYNIYVVAREKVSADRRSANQ